MNTSYDQIKIFFEHFHFQWFGKIFSNHKVSRTIINLYFSLVNYILHKEMDYMNIPGI